MTIRNDKELEETVGKVNDLLQQIQAYAGRDFSKSAKIRFPRGFLRQAADQKARFSFLTEKHLRSNLAYTVLLSDVQHWLLVRTDLSGFAREMVLKLQFFLLGTIVESVTKAYLKGKCGGSYSKRLEFLDRHGVIDGTLRTDLNWLWDVRNRMHLFQLTDTEWASTDYTLANYNRAVRAMRLLLTALS